MFRYHAIYISPEAEGIIGAFSDGEDLSARVNRIIMRYRDITLTDCPALTENEWNALFDLLRDRFCDNVNTPHALPSYIYTSICSGKDREQKSGEDTLALASRLSNLPYTQQCAVIEVIRYYYENHASCSCESLRQCLERSGARVI